MSEDQCHQRAEASRRGQGGLETGEGDTEPSMLLQKLKSNISSGSFTVGFFQQQDVQRFSDNDKLYLYLQLPSGPSSGDKSGSDSSSFNTADQLHTCNWIRSHLEEHSDTCLPKQDVYETYKYCENLQQRPLSAANFGKIIRDIFPNIKARRLGGRGQSKYPFRLKVGIRRKTVLNMPLLPNLDLKNDPSYLFLVQTYKQEVTEAACELICDWAQKILKRSFDTVVEIARYLIQEHIVNPRCSQAELVSSAALAGLCVSVCVSVEAFIKQLPRILPRSSIPDKTLTVRSSPPSLAPKDASGVGEVSGHGGPTATTATSGGGVKVIAMATLPQQQGGPFPVMILPQSCLSYEREKVAPPPPPQQQHAPSAPTSVVQKVRGGAAKRPLEVVVSSGSAIGSSTPTNTTPVKRKRGRPRKPRPEDSLPAPPTTLPPPPLPPAPPPPPSIISSVTGGVIQKASSSSASSQPVLELVIQEPPGMVLGAVEHRGVVVQCPPEVDRHSKPLLLLQSPGNQSWELAASGRTQMVEVIQKAPRPSNNNSATTPPTAHLPAPPLPLPTLHEEQGEVEITLTPVQPHVSLPPPPPPSTSSAGSASPATVMKNVKEEAESSTSSQREGH
uniref:Regulatory factor X, 5 n=1 Tax=Pundamilia nyererei TaxID=303518 RepID=A0A3B4FDP0_9CICH